MLACLPPVKVEEATGEVIFRVDAQCQKLPAFISVTYKNVGKSASRESEKDEGCSEHLSGGCVGGFVKTNVLVGGESVRVAQRRKLCGRRMKETMGGGVQFSFFHLHMCLKATHGRYRLSSIFLVRLLQNYYQLNAQLVWELNISSRTGFRNTFTANPPMIT